MRTHGTGCCTLIHLGNHILGQLPKKVIDFPSKKVAVFVDGCFWHSCPIHSRLPKSREDYWHPKLKRNIKRDKAKNRRLERDGWKVLRFWGHELKKIDEVAKKIQNYLNLF